jgi:hypothetical protein
MKKKLLLVYVFIAFVLLCTNVYAVITMDLGLTADKKEVEPGNNVIVTVTLKNPSASISSIEGYINVDENVVDAVSKDMIVTNDNKIEVKSGDTVVDKLTYAYNPSATDADYGVIFNTNKDNIGDNDCFFVMDFSKDISSTDVDILSLKLKVKDSATVQDVSNVVKVNAVVAYSADKADKTAEMSAALDIKVVKEETNDDNNNVTNENTNKNTNNAVNNTNTNKNNNTNVNTNNTNKNTNNTNTNKANTNTNNNTNSDATVAGTSIPKAGARFLVIPVIVFAILAYISYNKYIKYKDI